MKHTLIHQGKRAGIALAAVAAFTALGTGTPQAAPPANNTDFYQRQYRARPFR